MSFGICSRLMILAATVALLAIGCGGRTGVFKSGSSSGRNFTGLGKKAALTNSERDIIEAHAQYATALVHDLNGETEAALGAFYQAALRDSANETLVMEVSRRLLQAKQPEKALEVVSRATAQPNPSANLYARLGFIHFQLGNTNEAVAANRTAIQRDRKSFVSYQNLFLIHLQTRRPADALKTLDEAARVQDVEPEFLIGLGELYANYGLQVPAERAVAFERGTNAIKRALQQNPTEAHVRLRLADAFNALGQSTDAAAIYRELLGEMEDLPFMRDAVRAKLTDIYLRGRDTKQAAEQLQDLIRANPTDIQAHYILGSIHYAETNYTAAAEAFSRVLVLNPDFEQAYYDLAAAQLNAEQTSDALATLGKVREKFPQKLYGEYLTGLAYSQKEDYTNALKHFTSAEVIAEASGTPNNVLRDTFYFQLGATCERVADYARAEKYFEKCLELSPNHDEAQNYLGYMLAERGEKLDRAKALIERALVADPKNAAYLDSMGWVLFKLNQPKEALPYLLDAIKLSEEPDATLYDHLGDVYAALNEPAKAREAWEKSLSLQPNDIVKRKLESAAK